MHTPALLSSAFALIMASGFAGQYAQAHEPLESPTYQRCMDNSNGVTRAMLDCAGAEIIAQDARVNRDYKALMATLEPPKQNQLRTAQRLWIKFRDADCEFLVGLTGGTIDALNHSSCILDKTQQRADQLALLLNPETPD